MIKLGKISDFTDKTINKLTHNEKQYLLVCQREKFYLLEDKCGHFGVSLSTGRVENDVIICSEHGISFSLATGEVINRPFEACDPINTYDLIIKNDCIYYDLLPE